MADTLTPEQKIAALETALQEHERSADRVADEAISLFLEFRDAHGYDEKRAHAAAVAEISDGTRAIRDCAIYHAEEQRS